jgi:hypothetical protein
MRLSFILDQFIPSARLNQAIVSIEVKSLPGG